jgi:hypothetical protein
MAVGEQCKMEELTSKDRYYAHNIYHTRVDKRAALLDSSDQGRCRRRHYARLQLDMIHQAYQGER